MNSQEAAAAVARRNNTSPGSYNASEAPKGSVHEGVWYVSERDSAAMLIDDSVWCVLPSGKVTREIPVGNPMNAARQLLDD